MRFRPMGLTDILDEAFRIYRARFPLFAGLALLTGIPTSVIYILFYNRYLAWITSISGDPSGGGQWGDLLITLMLGLLQIPVGLILLPFYISPLVLVASETILGRPITLGGALEGTWRRYWKLWVINFLLGLLVAAVYSALIGALEFTIFGVLFPPLLLGVVVMAALIAPFLWLLIKLLGSLPVPFVENSGLGACLGRSWTLTRARWWWTTLIMFVTMILSTVVFLGIAPVIAGLILLLLSLVPGIGQSVQITLLLGVERVVEQLSAPLLAIVITLVYFDLRVRQEAFDLEWMSYEMRQRAPNGAAG